MVAYASFLGDMGESRAAASAVPSAPAWGQAASEEEGNVSSSEDARWEQAPSGPARPRRQARPNTRLVGPEWV
jgi:hypothetical protein